VPRFNLKKLYEAGATVMAATGLFQALVVMKFAFTA
jgi:hypothetical protein